MVHLTFYHHHITRLIHPPSHPPPPQPSRKNNVYDILIILVDRSHLACRPPHITLLRNSYDRVTLNKVTTMTQTPQLAWVKQLR